MTSASELMKLLGRLKAATEPEEIFGKLTGTVAEQLKTGSRLYHRLAKDVFVDHYKGASKKTAEEASVLLNVLWARAEEKIRAGRYGVKPKFGVTIATKIGSYEIEDELPTTGYFALYRAVLKEKNGERAVLLKTAREPRDNDLLENEARILKILAADAKGSLKAYIPEILDTFVMSSGKGASRRVNVFPVSDKFYSLAEVMAEYPEGSHPRTVAWVWKRLLTALGFAHANGVVHGAVLPENVLVNMENHGLALIDWSYAVHEPATTGEHIRAIVPEHEEMYPPEVAAKASPTPATDVFMSAMCMVALANGKTGIGALPASMPRPLRGLILASMLRSQSERPQDAWVLLDELTEVLETVFGKPKFYKVEMPRSTTTKGARAD